MKSGSINSRIMAAGAAVLILGVASAGTGFGVAWRLSHGLAASTDAATALRNHMEADMMHDALHADVLAAIMSSDPANGLSIADVKTDVAAHAKQFQDSLQANRSLITDPAAKAALAELDAPLATYISSAQAIVDQAAGDPAGARGQLASFKQQFDVLEGAMEKAGDTIDAGSRATSGQAIGAGKFAQVLMLGVLAAMVVFAIGLIMVARRTLVTPIVDVTNALSRLAAGDLDVVPPHTGRGDEIGSMARALHAFKAAMAGRQSEAEAAEQRRQLEVERAHAEEIRQRAEAEQVMVMTGVSNALEHLAKGDLTYRFDERIPDSYRKLQTDFNEAIGTLEETMQVILAHAEGIRSGAGEISHASDDLSKRTERQAATLEETAAAVEEITATVKKAAEGARSAHTAVADTKVDAERGGAVAHQAISAMSEIEASSSQIGEIIGVIDEIAFQTNLLALNAGVEAARAGDAGKGFAVVASEVRALAQRSAEAAKEIKGLVELSSRNVATGVNLVGQTGDALSLIVGKVADINHLVSQIAASSQEQSLALGEVNLAVNEMDQVTQQNAAMVEQSTAASHSLAKDATDLSQLVGRFRISEPSRQRRAA
ncbi:methyl-accepting chemotaxis protein [Phenylobacterium aquaticum]|uniref:methyl-accepting chemotaxis protein n=2 Tax=Phenylobacterium aquaticum TaxID=1763816 RepID=UPI0026F2C912|nr:methyl-accepting chemotaxis protein [Phenylobacterium aquaticum]